jgi:hypothetical protein
MLYTYCHNSRNYQAQGRDTNLARDSLRLGRELPSNKQEYYALNVKLLADVLSWYW